MDCGGELTNCTSGQIDFSELFDNSLDGPDMNELSEEELNSTVTTPLMVKAEPIFSPTRNWILMISMASKKIVFLLSIFIQ